MTFTTELSTLQKYETLLVYDIGIENWTPQNHYNDQSQSNPRTIAVNNTSHNLRETVTSEDTSASGEKTDASGETGEFTSEKTKETIPNHDMREPTTNTNENVVEVVTDTVDATVTKDEAVTSGEITTAVTKEETTSHINIAQVKDVKAEDDEFFDVMSTHSDPDDDPDDLYYFDAFDSAIPEKPGTVMHLTIDYQTIGNHVKGEQHHVKFVNSEHVDAMLDDIDYYELTSHTLEFDTFVHAVSTV